MGNKVLGDYDEYTKTIRFRPSLTHEQAFTTAVHEMVHHHQELTKIDCDKIVRQATKKIGIKRIDSNLCKNLLYSIAGDEYEDSNEVVAYSISCCAVGKGNKLAKAIYDEYLGIEGK